LPGAAGGASSVYGSRTAQQKAELEAVWQLHADVNAWPTWQTDTTAAHIDGAFQPGSSFEWTSYGFTVVSTIYALAERARVLWGWHGRRHHRSPRMGL
jgi:hypothetical protein